MMGKSDHIIQNRFTAQHCRSLLHLNALFTITTILQVSIVAELVFRSHHPILGSLDFALMTVINDTARLADHAASLSTKLAALPKDGHHEKINSEILTIADEMARLSSTLWQLHDAVHADPMQYTDAFNEDLKEIMVELTSVLEEISDCCKSLWLADSNVSSVTWFFRKGRVSRLLQHLEALKGTLLVMRTVLWHGKEYGTHRSDRLAEANPHVLHEDRVILESVISRNRDAIIDLHNLVKTMDDPHDESETPETLLRAGDFHRQLSEATGVDTQPISDVLPLPIRSKENFNETSAPVDSPEAVRRTFSKRGVRLGVHMSILDLSAHDAPDSLKEKWIQQANRRRRSIHEENQTMCRRPGGLTALPGLSRISEADTTAALTTGPGDSPPVARSVMQHDAPEQSYTTMQTPTKEIQVPPNTPVECVGCEKKYNEKIGNKLRKVVSKLSMANLRTPSKTQE